MDAREFWNVYLKLANYEQDECERESNRLARLSDIERGKQICWVNPYLKDCIKYLVNQKLELRGAA